MASYEMHPTFTTVQGCSYSESAAYSAYDAGKNVMRSADHLKCHQSEGNIRTPVLRHHPEEFRSPSPLWKIAFVPISRSLCEKDEIKLIMQEHVGMFSHNLSLFMQLPPTSLCTHKAYSFYIFKP